MVLLKKAGTSLISIVAMLCRIMTKIALSKLFLHDFFIFFLVIALVYYDLELCPGSMQIYLRQKISKKYHTGFVIYHFSKCIDWSASPLYYRKQHKLALMWQKVICNYIQDSEVQDEIVLLSKNANTFYLISNKMDIFFWSHMHMSICKPFCL